MEATHQFWSLGMNAWVMTVTNMGCSLSFLVMVMLVHVSSKKMCL